MKSQSFKGMQKILLICTLLIGSSKVGFSQSGSRYGDPLLDSLYKVTKSSKLDSVHFAANADMCFYLASTEPKAAIKYGVKAVEMARELNLKEGEAEANRYIGICYQNQSNNLEAQRYFMKALKMHEKIGNLAGIARAHTSIGFVHTANNDFKKAEAHYKKAIHYFTLAKDYKNIGSVYNRLGIMSIQTDDYKKGKQYLLQASKHILNYGGDSLKIEGILSNLGQCDHYLGEYKEGEHYFLTAIRLNEKSGNAIFEGNHKSGLGRLYGKWAKELSGAAKAEKLRQAEQLLLEGLKIQDETGNFGAGIEYYLTLSDVQEQMGKYDLALQSYKKHKEYADSLFSEENIQELEALELNYEFEKKQAVKVKEIERQKAIRNSMIVLFIVAMIFAIVFLFQRIRIRKEKQKSDNLLLNILPNEIAAELKTYGEAKAKHHDETTILFTDFKGFTQLSEKLTPEELVAEIDYCFSNFDRIIGLYGLEKIKTIGDAYMAASGIPNSDPDHALKMTNAAIEIRDFMIAYQAERKLANKQYFELRIGLHSGNVIAGIVGVKKFAYDVWGDTVNTAARMESSGEIGKINVSEATYERIKDHFTCSYRGKIEAKGKGEISMYFVEKK